MILVVCIVAFGVAVVGLAAAIEHGAGERLVTDMRDWSAQASTPARPSARSDPATHPVTPALPRPLAHRLPTTRGQSSPAPRKAS
jgi:hypothetical protein